MAALGDREIVALLNLARRRGVVQANRAEAITNLLRALPAGDVTTDTGVVGVVEDALLLADTPAEVVNDVVALVSACADDAEAIHHARSLLDVAVRAQPPERRRLRRSAPEGATDA